MQLLDLRGPELGTWILSLMEPWGPGACVREEGVGAGSWVQGRRGWGWILEEEGLGLWPPRMPALTTAHFYLTEYMWAQG